MSKSGFFMGFITLWIVSTSIIGQNNQMHGITLMAPMDTFAFDPMKTISEISCDYIAVVPYAFTPHDESKVYYNHPHQWWGERSEGVRTTIDLAHKRNMNAMLKPQVWIHDVWVGDHHYNNEDDWKIWETDYRSYILHFAQIAEETDVALYCIGTEFKKATIMRTEFWSSLIDDVRKIYSGQLTYCANWDEYDKFPLWDKLDLIGISAYFPLTDTHTPSVVELKKRWSPIKKSLKKFSQKYNKKIFFAEYGYMSIDGCAGKTWALEPHRRETPSNQLAQSNAFEALWSTFCDEEFWLGGFLWKWFPGGIDEHTYYLHDYTPQNKSSIEVLKRFFYESKDDR